MEKKENLILEKSFTFSLSIIELFKHLKSNNEFIISKQLLRSWTIIGANINESTDAQSKADFIHKMSIASKEARETKYWLMLLNKSQLVVINLEKYIKEIDEIINIHTAIVKTSQQNNKN